MTRLTAAQKGINVVIGRPGAVVVTGRGGGVIRV